KQFQVQIASRFIGETLEEFAGQPKTKSARHVLVLFRLADRLVSHLVQSPPNQMRSPAEIHHAPGQAFIHGHVGFPREWIAWIETRAISTNAFFLAERLLEGLP